MNCRQWRGRLDAYADRELSPQEMAQIEEHLAECRSCRTIAVNLQRLRDSVREAAGQPDAPAYLVEEVRQMIAPRWYRSTLLQAIAASILLAGALTLFVPGVRGMAATALDCISIRMDDSRQVVVEGVVVCRDCELAKKYGYAALCPLSGHHGWLATSDGRYWAILEGTASDNLIHDPSLIGKRVQIQGRMFRKAGSIEVASYALL
jgi:Putative zinc-finger